MSEKKLHGFFFKQEHGQKRDIGKCRFIKTEMSYKTVSFAEICLGKKIQESFGTVSMSGLDTFRANSVSVSS